MVDEIRLVAVVVRLFGTVVVVVSVVCKSRIVTPWSRQLKDIWSHRLASSGSKRQQ